MHVFVIYFVIVPIWGLLLFLQEYLQDHYSMSGTCMLKRHTVNSKLSAVDSFPVPNVCTCNAVKISIISLKCCEKSYVSCRPYCVGWRKYLHCSDAFTRCWHTDIHLLYFCTPDFIIWWSWVKGQNNIWNSGFIHCKYHTGWTALYYDCHNWLYICSILNEDGIIVFLGHSSRSQVKHCCSC